MKRVFCMIFVFLFIFIFAFVSCSSKKKKEETLKIEEEISQEISAEEGGKIENSDKSVSIEVPGEALESDTKITMKIYDAGKYIGTEGKDFISKVVEFEPSGTIFKKPVIITMKSLKDVENKIISAAVYRDEKGEWSYSKRGAYVILTGRDEGGDPIMKSAGGDPIMLNAGGDPIMIPEDGGDPIMLSAGGDPIMVKAGGDPIMQDEGGDPIMQDEGGDPIMNAAGGDPIMHAAGGDPIMMTTGHFTAYGFIALEPTGEEAVENPDKDDETTDKDDDNTEITENDDVINDEDEISDNDDDNIEITEDDDAINDEDETPDEIEDLDPINPCDGNPCQEIANSTHECLIQDDGYACGCNTGYAWNGAQCVVPLGRICTGQNKCYDNEGEIECPAAGEDFYGQDAQYAALGTCVPQSFTIDDSVAGEAVVIDNNTGLIWQQSPSEETFTWDDAITYCENLTYAGNSNWRLPNPLELLTIVDKSKYAPATNSNFTNMPTGSTAWFWTSKEYKKNTSYAYTFNTDYGDYIGYVSSDSYLKTKTHQVLCVSGYEMQPATSSNFTTETISDSVVVTDSATGLMWQKTYETKTWEAALYYCENLTYAGYSDWRLPNINELASLVNYEKSEEPYSDFPDMPDMHDCFSSSTRSGYTDNAWSELFNYGGVIHLKTESFYVRCVRSDLPSNSERTSACTGLPENAEWNSASTFTQTWNGSAWLPSATAVYSEEASTENCRFKCAEGFEWNDYECVRTTPLSLGNICTGQDKCYNTSAEIECPTAGEDFYGQDAQYAALGTCTPQSFTVQTISGNNVVFDNNTGLEWQQSPTEETFTWDDAITYCENLTYAGNSDWRLPNPLEFLTIVDNSKSDPATNSNFTNMEGSSVWFWTSKEYKGFTSYAYVFRPFYGYYSVSASDSYLKTKTYQVLCVSGDEMQPATSSNFTTETINGADVVTDSATGLMWMKTYETSKTWQAALKFCAILTYAGYSDWRLPNKNELASLVNYEISGAPYSYFPDMPIDYFWSSSTYTDTRAAWFVYFSNGGNVNGNLLKTNVSDVRCVRSE